MKLYRIYQTENNEDETYDSAVVVANNEHEARQIYPGISETGLIASSNEEIKRYWVLDKSKVFVEYLGEYEMQGDYPSKTVICRSYNSGYGYY